MSYYESIELVTMVAGEALAKHDMVHINGGSRRLLKITDVDAEGICGVVQESVAAGEGVPMAIGGVSKILAGATITAGQKIGSDVNAKAVPAVAGTKMMGIALAGGAAGTVLPAIIYIGETVAAANVPES